MLSKFHSILKELAYCDTHLPRPPSVPSIGHRISSLLPPPPSPPSEIPFFSLAPSPILTYHPHLPLY
jgi:hypothetical protein